MTAASRVLRWTGPLTGAIFLGGVFGAIKLADRRFPKLGSPPQEVKDYYVANPRSAILSATGQAASATSLIAFVCAFDRIARCDDHRRWVRVANAIGGGSAAAALSLSAITTARLRRADRMAVDESVALSRRAFVAGGPAHGVGFGVMTAALTAAGSSNGALGSRLTGLGIVASVAGILCPSYFAAETAGWLIPIGRFSGLALLAIGGKKLAAAADLGTVNS
jgi:hypothetical protein